MGSWRKDALFFIQLVALIAFLSAVAGLISNICF